MDTLLFFLYFGFIAFILYVEARHWSTMTQRYEDDDEDDILYNDFEYDDDDWEDEIYE